MKLLDKNGLEYFLEKIKSIFATTAQGKKADTAVQSVKIGSTEYKSGTSVVLPSYPTTLPASDVSSWAKASTKPTYTASEVGADAAGSAAAVQENLDEHTSNTSNPHSVTKSQIGLGSVENKSSATIRGELTKENVTNALGYTPPKTNTTYSAATSSALGLVKSGTDITVDSSGNVSVNDDSHNHVISNVDGLQDALDGKAASSHGTHVTYSTTAPVMNGTASVGSATTVSRSDHVHPTDTSRAAASHEHSAYVNQNAFSNVAVGSTTIVADTTTDTLTIAAGSNVTITPDATNDKITISATDTVYTHPTTSGNKHIPRGGSSGQILRWSADGTAVWGSDNNTTYSNATTSAAGLMSASDKAKLDSISVEDNTGFTTYINASAPESPSGYTIWIYNENAYSYVSGDMVISGSEPTDKSNNPTWLT